MSYEQLNLKQRFQLETLLEAGWLQKDIANHIGTDPSTVSRELARNGSGVYNARAADAKKRKRRKVAKRKIKILLINEKVHAYVEEKLKLYFQVLTGDIQYIGESPMAAVLSDVFTGGMGNGEAILRVRASSDVVAQCVASQGRGDYFDLIIPVDPPHGSKELAADNAARMIREMDAFKDVPIVVVSRAKRFEDYLKAGITAWVDSRASRSDFVAALKTAMKGKGEIPRQPIGSSWSLIAG